MNYPEITPEQRRAIEAVVNYDMLGINVLFMLLQKETKNLTADEADFLCRKDHVPPRILQNSLNGMIAVGILRRNEAAESVELTHDGEVFALELQEALRLRRTILN